MPKPAPSGRGGEGTQCCGLTPNTVLYCNVMDSLASQRLRSSPGFLGNQEFMATLSYFSTSRMHTEMVYAALLG